MNRIRVNGFDFDPLAGKPVLPPALRHDPVAHDALHYHIVQLDRRVTHSMKQELTASGATILHYINYNAFLVAADADSIHRIDGIPFVRWRGPFEPAYKLSPRLSVDYDRIVNEMLARVADDGPAPERIDTSIRIPVEILTMESFRVSEVAAATRRHGGRTSGRSVRHGGSIQAEIPRTALEKLAREPGVLWIDRKVPNYPLNDVAAWTIQSNSPGVVPVHQQGIFGTGQTVTIADSGLDYEHDAFEDPLVPLPGPGHRKVTAYYVPDGDGVHGNDSDQGLDQHGTHVAGTLAGDDLQPHIFDGDGVPSGDDQQETLEPHDGQAFDAMLQVQDLSDPDFGNAIFPPDDFHDLFAPARDANSWIHSNSWGFACCGGYGTDQMNTDDFIWDNANFVVLFAAGNIAGSPLPEHLNPHAAAKNVIAVGASGNGLPSSNNLPSFFGGFSSGRGPTADGRLKPDVVAPGVDIWSARGCDPGQCDDYRKTSGTSMATPAVAGAATLVRQYYMDGWYPSGASEESDKFTPSAALIKATLINSGDEMTGPGTGANDEGGFPNMNQGWGRIQLDRVLHFAGSARALQVHDEADGVGTDEVASYEFAVGDTAQPFEVTLVWSDFAAMPNVGSLVNDLDLVVTAPDGTIYRGNQFVTTAPRQSRALTSLDELEPDVINNVEGVMVVSGVRLGVWNIQVHGQLVPMGKGVAERQPYALVVTGGAAPRHAVLDIQGNLYRSGTSIPITLADSDMNSNPGSYDSVIVSVSSDTESVPEPIVLQETAPDSAVFTGEVTLDASATPQPADGELQVQDGDTILASYFDADDGLGGSGLRTDSALVDDEPPGITGVQVSEVGTTSATIIWSTNELADSDVQHGPTAPPSSSSSEPDRGTSHAVILKNLFRGTTYSFSVSSTDEAGNTATDDNGSAYYQFTTLAQSGDEPSAEWPTFQNDPHRRGSSPSRMSPPLTPVWSSSPIANGRSRGPVMAGGRLFSTTTDGYVRARNAFTGGLLWERQLGDANPAAATPAMPVAGNGVVYVTFSSFGTAMLHALDATTGATLWTSSGTTMLLLSGDHVIAVQGPPSQIVALNPSDGSIAWLSPPIDGVVAAASSEGRLLVGTISLAGTTSATLFALSEQDGQILWSQILDGWMVSAPLAVSGKVYVGTDRSSTSTGSFYALDASTGSVSWQVTGFGRISSTAAYDGTALYFSSTNLKNRLRNGYHALRASDGKILWQRALSSPGWQGSLAHAFHSLFGLANDGNFRALDDATGLTIESIDLGSTCAANPTSFNCFYSSPAVAAGWVWVQDGQGAIHAYQAQLADEDADGEPDDLDCLPLDGSIFHGATEVCNGIDDNCDGSVDNLGTGTCDPDIRAEPTSYDFGAYSVGESSPAQSFLVTNQGHAPLNIGAVSIAGVSPCDFMLAADGCTGQSLSMGGSCTLQVVFTPKLTGVRSGALSLLSNDPDTPQLAIPLSGSAQTVVYDLVELPNADAGPNQGSPTPSGAHYLNVDDDPHDGDTTHLAFASGGSKEVFTVADQLHDTDVITRVKVRWAAKKGSGDDWAAKAGLVVGGQEYYGPTVELTQDYSVREEVFTTNPATGQPWTVQDVRAAKLVYQQVSITMELPRARLSEIVLVASARRTPIGASLVELPNGDAGPNHGSPTPAGAHYLNVDDDPHDGDTTHLAFASGGSKEVFSIADQLLDTDLVTGVSVRWAAKKGSGEWEARAGLVLGAQEYYGPTVDMTGGYSVREESFPNNPATGCPWTVQDVRSLKLVYQQVSSPMELPKARLTEIVLVVSLQRMPVIATLTELPNSDASPNQGSPSPSGAHYLNVDEDPHDGNTTHLKFAAAGAKEVYTTADQLHDSDRVQNLKVRWVAKKGSGSDWQAKAGLVIGGQEHYGSTVDLTAGFVIREETFPNNPATGQPWTVAEVRAAKLIYQQVTTTMQLPRAVLTELVLIVTVERAP
ncbi:MAG: S8 family serine peptidase [Candidatus Polarisedimenticolia bacterium]